MERNGLMGNVILKCTNLSKTYDFDNALNNVNLSIETGKIIGLLGPNGSGKTTFIKLLNGLLKPTEGEIFIDGKNPGVETKKIVAYLPDKNYLDNSKTVNAILQLFADFYEYVLKEVNDLKNSAFCTDNTFEYVGLVFYKFSIAYTWTSQYEQALHFADQSLNYIPPQSDSYELVKKNRDKIYLAISNHKYKEKFWNIINGIRVIIFIFAVCAGIYSCITEPSASKKEPVKSPRDTNIQKELTPQSDIKTGYVPNTNILNTTGYSTITIDNTQNNVPVYVRLWSVGNNPYPVRTFTISPNNSFTALSITPGTYEIRYKFLYKEKEASFGNKSEPFKLSEIHTNTGIEYDQFKLTLYKVRNGNTHTYQVPVDEI